MSFTLSSTQRPLASSSRDDPYVSASRPPAPKVTTPPDLPSLQAGSRVLQDQLVKDAQIVPDLADLLAQVAPASYSVAPQDWREPFEIRKSISIPEELFNHYDSVNPSSMMGLLPEIDRVWISIDHKLFLWDYVEGSEISSFVEQLDLITHVALVKPRAGVFIDDIQYLIVICTPITVLLLGLSVVPTDGRKQINLYATDMTLSTNNVEMNSVSGTKDGRIFMCGATDGNLYELKYRSTEGWFSKKIELLNHSAGGYLGFLPTLGAGSRSDNRIVSVVVDDTRQCLYTLTTSPELSVYQLASDGSLKHVSSYSSICKRAQEKAPAAGPALDIRTFQIIQIHVIQPSESKGPVHLVAVTSMGVRLYFTHQPRGPGGYGTQYGGFATSTSSSVSALHMLYVRLPPTNMSAPREPPWPQPTQLGSSFVGNLGAPNQAVNGKSVVVSGLTASCYEAGLLIAAQAGEPEGSDYVLATSSDLSKIGMLGQSGAGNAPSQGTTSLFGQNYTYGTPKPPLTEHAMLLSIAGHTWAVHSVPRSSLPSSSSPPESPAPLSTNDLATQFSEPARQFMVLTNAGLSMLVKRRPMDFLRDALNRTIRDGSHESLKQFRFSYGRDQACCMLLGFICGNTFVGMDVLEQNVSSVNDLPLPQITLDLSNAARQAFYEIGERPSWTERSGVYPTGDSSTQVSYSGRREGLALYFARLARPIWRSKIAKKSPTTLTSNVPDNTLVVVQRDLSALKTFLENSPQIFASSPGEHTAQRSTGEQEAWKLELNSISQLQSLLSRTIEAISFVLLLSDYKLGDIVSKCDADTQKAVATLTYAELVSTETGINVSRALVNVVINQQIGQQISIDTVSDVLQQRCGSFCSTHDVMLYKARENIRKAGEVREKAQRQHWLSESLRMFIKGSEILDLDKLRDPCEAYQKLKYPKGTVELPLHCAAAWDAANAGRDYWAAGCPPNDARSEAYEKRRKCYDLVVQSLSNFETQEAETPADQPVLLEEARNTTSIAFDLALQSRDPLFHSYLYDWLISRGLTSVLLSITSDFLESHLSREPRTLEKSQLLWQYYVKIGQYLSAAYVLAEMAQSPLPLSLEIRLECLSRAIGNAKSHPVSVQGRHEAAVEFLADLEDKLEVAQVQLELYHLLLPRVSESYELEQRVEELNRRLMDISELYREYAEPLELLRIQLVILNVSEHRDDSVVKPIWNKIVDQAIDNCDDQTAVDRLSAAVIEYGSRFSASEYAFPLKHIASLLERFALANLGLVPRGWTPRILVASNVTHLAVWEVLHEMYESQIPPFHAQANVQALSADISVLLNDWIDAASRDRALHAELPRARLDEQIDVYLRELTDSEGETKRAYERVKQALRRDW